jgi:hypothetical protein
MAYSLKELHIIIIIIIIIIINQEVPGLIPGAIRFSE